MADQQHHDERPLRSSSAAIFERINKVEGDFASMREQIAGMNVNLTSQGQTLTRIAITLDQRGATDWKSIWSAASVVLALIAIGGTLILQPIKQQIEANRVSVSELNEMKVIEARTLLEDMRETISEAEQRGRYMERVDRIDRELHRAKRGDGDE
jgi:hypothetical protein